MRGLPIRCWRSSESSATTTGSTPTTPCPSSGRSSPDWSSFIAANLVVDGILTTFVASARDSSIEPLAQRARKILQEEGAHKVHAEAWAKRIRRAEGPDLELLNRRIAEMWAQAARWPGAADHPGYRHAIAEGMLSEGPAAIRGRVRDWLTVQFDFRGPALERAGRLVGLGRGAPTMSITCPFCDSADVETRVGVGRPDDHQPDALPQLPDVLRGGAAGV